MPRHNDDSIFPPQSPVAGAKLFGSTSSGQSAQFTIAGLVAYMQADSKTVVQYAAATGVGQTIVANTNSGSPDFPSINGGREFQGTINTWPPTIRDHFDMIYEVIA